MILDRLEQLPQYLGIHPHLDIAINALSGMNLKQLPDGRHEVANEAVFINVGTNELGENKTWEAHKKYMDLQIVLNGREAMAWAPAEDLRGFSPYDEQKDLMLSPDAHPGSSVLVEAGMFALFMPKDAHRPGMGTGQARKAVVKVLVDIPEIAPYKSQLNHTGTVSLKTSRLLLRAYQAGDAQEMYDNWCSDPEVSKTLQWETHESPQETKIVLDMWLKAYGSGRSYHWALEKDGELIGDLALMHLSETNMSGEIGYCLSRRFWNQGLMSEAVISISRHLFSQVGMKRIVIRHLTDNPASGRVIQKAGYHFEGIARQAIRGKDGQLQDIAVYAALQEEWLAAHPD